MNMKRICDTINVLVAKEPQFSLILISMGCSISGA